MKKEKYVIDRIEEGIIVLLSCVDDIQIEVPADKFPDELFENDIVYVSFDKDGVINEIIADKEETEEKKARMKKKLLTLFDDKV